MAVLSYKVKRNLAVALSALALSGCGLFDNKTGYEPVSLSSYAQTASIKSIWTADIGSGSGVGFAPAITPNAIIAATPDGSLASVNPANGAIVWKVQTGKSLSAGVGTDGRVAVVADNQGNVKAYDASNGKALWTSKSSTAVSTPPAVGNGVVVIRADDYRVIAYSETDGSLLWSYQRTNPDLALDANSRMVVVGDVILVGVPTGRLVALDLKTGNEAWNIPVAQISGTSEIQRVVDVVGEPVVFNNGFCVASYQSQIGCYQSSNNGITPTWSVPYSSSGGVSVGASSLFATGSHGEVTNLNPANGQKIWENNELKNRGLTNAVAAGKYIAVGDYQGYVHFINVQNGQLAGRTELSGDAIVSPLLSTQQGVVVQTGDGKLVLLGVN